MKEDHDFVSKSTNLFIEITGVVPCHEATFDGPAEGGDIYFRAYNESGKDVTNELDYSQENLIKQEAAMHLRNEPTISPWKHR